jgi:hypothetical protein
MVQHFTFTFLSNEGYRDTCGLTQEWLFKSLYDNAWMRFWLSGGPVEEPPADWGLGSNGT